MKRFHPDALQLTGENLTDFERAMIDRYFAGTMALSPWELAMNQRTATCPEQFRLNRKRFMAKLIAELEPILGPTAEDRGGGNIVFLTALQNCTLQTFVDVGGRGHQLTYSHSIYISPNAWLQEHASILAWLGISGQTSWEYLSEADTPEAAKTLAALCSYFFNAAQALLKDP